MLSPDLYIQAAAAIAPDALPDEPAVRFNAKEPDYAGIIPPMQLRRMSKVVRMGIGAAYTCLQEARIERPDAIIVGTALGCLGDTEVFLRKMVEQDEQMLTPTAFIQSTHNTVAGQIALATGCHGYNSTIVQHGHSFEGAVMTAALHLAEQPDQQVLCGGADEMTETLLGLMQRVGVYAAIPYPPADMDSPHNGAIAGEGVGFLLLKKDAHGAKARVAGLELFTEYSCADAARRIQETLQQEGGLRNNDALLIGAFGDQRSEAAYATLPENGIRYRQRTGAWGTDTAIAIARLVNDWPEGKDRAWIISHWGVNWSIWLLEKV
jgi:3-oxoacyl-(acyl-carrier-protein) synthase